LTSTTRARKPSTYFVISHQFAQDTGKKSESLPRATRHNSGLADLRDFMFDTATIQYAQLGYQNGLIALVIPHLDCLRALSSAKCIVLCYDENEILSVVGGSDVKEMENDDEESEVKLTSR
jgi:hypothetical protein